MTIGTRSALVCGLVALLSSAAAQPAQAAPILTATVTPVGALFQFDYTLEFIATDPEILLVDINVLVNDATLQVVDEPAGYTVGYDSGLGLVFILPDLFFPSAGLVNFSLVSAHSSAPTTFIATTIDLDQLVGPTAGPLGPLVPEPATTLLVASGLGVLGGRRAIQKRRRARS